MSAPVTVCLVGIGGYGEVYLDALLGPQDQPGPPAHCVAAVDPAAQRSRRAPQLEDRGIPVFTTLEDVYLEVPVPDLIIVSSPIHWHARQTCRALSHGSHVLCEKPAAGAVQEVDQMLAAQSAATRHVAVGFQWSFSPSIQALKRDIHAGRYGAPRRLRSFCLWPRDESYYRRADWAGRLRAADGTWILDSPLNNAMAHDVHNLLYLIGPQPAASAIPREVTAELYRANDIENFDTAAVRIRTASGVEVLFFGSHAIAESQEPAFHLEFTEATIEHAGGRAPIHVRYHDGRRSTYPSPNDTPQVQKLWHCVDAITTGQEVVCGLAAARAHTLCVNGAQDSQPHPVPFPADFITRTGPPGRRLTHVTDLAHTLRECYRRSALPHELGLAWAAAGTCVSLERYRFFPGGGNGVLA